MPQKVFKGDRTIDGASVTVDETHLNERFDIRVFTSHGFEWSYEGDGPRQLALAILAEHLGDDQEAQKYCESFMSRIVANFGNEWEMTSDDVDTALKNIAG